MRVRNLFAGALVASAVAGCIGIVGDFPLANLPKDVDGGTVDVPDSSIPSDSASDSRAPSDVAASDSGESGVDCIIGGMPYAASAPNPGDACQTCEPSVSASAWTSAGDGTACGSAQICTMGACASGCEIAGIFYAASAANPNNPCQSCQPATSTSAWSTASDGTGCGNGQVCAAGKCGTQCDIGGTVYASGAANPANACQSCQPGTSTTAWTNVAAGTSCGTGDICSAGACAAGCFVGGTVYTANALNPANACQSCQPATSTTAWTNVAAGTSCGSGEVCNAGTCGSGCFIGGMVYAANAANPTNACQACKPGTSTTAWTNAGDGTSCGNGQVCASGQCGTQCDIGGMIYGSGAANPSNACQSCQPGTSTSAWTNVALGTGCGAGHVCSGSVCSPGCYIGGAVYSSGAPDSSNACLSCQPGTATTAWTAVPDKTTCGASGSMCCGGNCASCSLPANSTATCTGSSCSYACDPSYTTNCPGSPCTNLQTDGSNCGACGHDCLGGTCGAGQCQPVVLAHSATPANSRITSDGTYVAWSIPGAASAGGGVFSVLGTGVNQTPTTLASSPANQEDGVVDVAMYGGAVYWLGTNSASGGHYIASGTANVANSGATLSNLQSATPVALGMSPTGNVVAWIAYQFASQTVDVGTCTIGTFSCALGGTDTNSSEPADIATDGTFGYYTDANLIRKMILTTGAVANFVPPQTSPTFITYTSGYVYWVDGGSKAFLRQGSTGNPQQIVSNGSGGSGLAADNRYMYFTQGNGSVYFTKADGTGTVQVLAAGDGDIAIDATALYFFGSGGAVSKVALPR